MGKTLRVHRWALLLCVLSSPLCAGEKNPEYSFDEGIVLIVFDLAELRENAKKEGLSKFVMKRMREWTRQMSALRPADPDKDPSPEAARQMSILNRRMQELLSAARYYSIDYFEETCKRQSQLFRNQRSLVNLDVLPAELQMQVKKGDAFVAGFPPPAPSREQIEREKREAGLLADQHRNLDRQFEYLRQQLTKADADFTDLERKIAVGLRDLEVDRSAHAATEQKIKQMREHQKKLPDTERLAYDTQINNENTRAGDLYFKARSAETALSRLNRLHELSAEKIAETCKSLLDLSNQSVYASDLFNNPKLITAAEKKWIKLKPQSKQ